MKLSKEAITYLANNLANEFNVEVMCYEVRNRHFITTNKYIFTIEDAQIVLHFDPYSNKIFYLGDFHSIEELLEAMKAEVKKKTDISEIAAELAKLDIDVLKVAVIQTRYFTRYGIDVSEKWTTAVEQSRDLDKAYARGYADAMKDNANQKAFDLHKQTSCPLDECVKALKMEEPIDYLKDKARVRGEEKRN